MCVLLRLGSMLYLVRFKPIRMEVVYMFFFLGIESLQFYNENRKSAILILKYWDVIVFLS